jgi:hypothetical protein
MALQKGNGKLCLANIFSCLIVSLLRLAKQKKSPLGKTTAAARLAFGYQDACCASARAKGAGE